MRDYAVKLGRTPEELHAYFVREQDGLSELFERSAMAKLALSNDGAADDIVEEADALWRVRDGNVGAS